MRTLSKVLLIAAVAGLAPALASAQQPKLETGTWTGVVVPPDGQSADVTYDVATKNDTLTITINAGQFGTFPAQHVKLEADKLTFAFTPGPDVQCTLVKHEDGSYVGDCLDESGGAAHMTMLPPKKTGTTGT